jgi:predicted 2-oxoglutarate/Fe(II)-dependent dioxygenase YbiX
MNQQSPTPVQLDLTLTRRNTALFVESIDWLCTRQLLSRSLCKEIIDSCAGFELSPPVTVEEENLPNVRQADIRHLKMTDRTAWIFELLCDLAEESKTWTGGMILTEISRTPQYVEYRPGWGHFHWHNDYSHGLPMAPRKLTIIIQLSDPEDYEGGKLELFGPEIETMPNAMGSMIVFPSFLYHRVTPVTKGLRRALVAWISGPRIA